MTTEWTETMDARLTARWASGELTREIAEALGVSKNAVVGRAHRIHLPPRRSPIIYTTPRPERVKPATLEGSRARIAPVRLGGKVKPPTPLHGQKKRGISPEVAERQAYYRTLPTNGHGCEWLTGERREFKTCAQPAVVGYQFCPDHCGMAYLAPKKPARSNGAVQPPQHGRDHAHEQAEQA